MAARSLSIWKPLASLKAQSLPYIAFLYGDNSFRIGWHLDAVFPPAEEKELVYGNLDCSEVLAALQKDSSETDLRDAMYRLLRNHPDRCFPFPGQTDLEKYSATVMNGVLVRSENPEERWMTLEPGLVTPTNSRPGLTVSVNHGMVRRKCFRRIEAQ